MPYPMSKKPATRTPREAPPHAAVEELARAMSGVVLEALRELEGALSRPVDERRLVNFLRGNQAPPRSAERGGSTTAPGGVHGVLWAASAAWLGELIDALVDEGCIEPASAPKGGLVLSAAGERVLAGKARPPSSVLPRRPALGACPELEGRLGDLRRRLADAEGRPAFSVFSNATLAHLADRRPATVAELAEIPGLGEQRLRKYGRKILAVIRRSP